MLTTNSVVEKPFGHRLASFRKMCASASATRIAPQGSGTHAPSTWPFSISVTMFALAVSTTVTLPVGAML